MKTAAFTALALLSSTISLVAQEKSNPKFIFRAHSGVISTTAPSTDPGNPETETISASISGGTFTVGDTVNITGTVSGNSEPVVWTVASGSLGSLSLSSSGVISGVVSASGSFSAVLNVANSKSSTTVNVSLTVNASIPPLNVAANGGEFFAIKGQAITPHTINVDGGTSPYTSEFDASEFPSGISVSGLTVSGTAGAGVAAGDYEPIITVKDSGGQSGASLFKIKVRDVLALSASAPNPIYRGINYPAYVVSASGGQSPQIALANPSDAPGFSFNGNTLSGQISSVPNLNSATGIGSTSLQFTATDETGQTANIVRNFQIYDLPSFTATKTSNAISYEQSVLSYVFSAKAAPDASYTIQGTKPSWLSVNSIGMSGVPPIGAAGNYPVMIRISDSQGRTADQTVNVSVLPTMMINGSQSTILPTQNIMYGQSINIPLSVTGGSGGYSYSLAPGNPGITIDIAGGRIYGTPQDSGMFTITFSDSVGHNVTANLLLNVNFPDE